jgi:hypothetical protein
MIREAAEAVAGLSFYSSPYILVFLPALLDSTGAHLAAPVTSQEVGEQVCIAARFQCHEVTKVIGVLPLE